MQLLLLLQAKLTMYQLLILLAVSLGSKALLYLQVRLNREVVAFIFTEALIEQLQELYQMLYALEYLLPTVNPFLKIPLSCFQFSILFKGIPFRSKCGPHKIAQPYGAEPILYSSVFCTLIINLPGISHKILKSSILKLEHFQILSSNILHYVILASPYTWRQLLL